MEVGLCLRLSKVFNIICHLIDVALDNLNIVHEHIHGPLVGGHPHLLLAVNVVELGDISLTHYLVIEDVEFIRVKCEKLNFVALGPLILNMDLCFRKVCDSPLD
jgi:hypothetical protein